MTWTMLTVDEQASLAQRIRDGDPSAGEAFVQLFGERIRVLMLSRLRDPETARELTQDSLFAAWRAVREGKLRDPERLAAFVLATARNVANGYTRARAGAPRLEPLIGDVEGPPALADDETLEHRKLVAAALRGLSDSDRQVLRLTFAEGLRPREIAARLGLGMELVRTRKSRALKRVIDLVASLSRNDTDPY